MPPELLTESSGGSRSEHGYGTAFKYGKARQTFSPVPMPPRWKQVAAGASSSPANDIGTLDSLVNLVNWVNGYDITTIPWNSSVVGNFSYTVPGSGGWGPPLGTPFPNAPYSITNLPSGDWYGNKWGSRATFTGNGDGGAYTVLVTRALIELPAPLYTPPLNNQPFNPFPISYYIIDNSDYGGEMTFWQACASPIFTKTVDVSLPPPPFQFTRPTQENPNIWYEEYIMVVQTSPGGGYYPNPGIGMPTAPSIAAIVAANQQAYSGPGKSFTLGPDWNAGLACQIPSGPPFA